MRKVRQYIVLGSFVSLVALLCIEITARLSGIGDFPLYIEDAEIGYVVAPNQSGAFLRRNDWIFNGYSMASGPYHPDKNDNTLLIGDSIVQGGNPLPQRDKVGSQLEMLLGHPVWPVGAGGWALLNELAYLRRHRSIVSTMDRLIFISNSDDFGEPSFWTSDLDLPRKRPWSVALYAMRRYIFSPAGVFSPAAVQMPSSGRDWRIELSNLLEGYSGHVLMFLYPTRDELADPALRKERLDKHGDEAIALGKNNLTVVPIVNDPLWTSNLYRDSIHPTATGNRRLAQIIANSIKVEARLKKPEGQLPTDDPANVP